MNTLDWIGSIFLTNDKVSIDISEAVIKIELTEDLFSQYPMGYMLIQDMPSNNLISKKVVNNEDNASLLLFFSMIGHHFDTIYYHTKSIEKSRGLGYKSKDISILA